MKPLKIYVAFMSAFLNSVCYGTNASSLEHFTQDEWASRAAEYPCQETYDSWKRLQEDYTDQSLQNFEDGIARGVFFVHSLECIMGAIPCFTMMWNKNHPDDQRRSADTLKDFHTVFTYDEYVTHYHEYVIKQRLLVSGSVVAFNDLPQHTLGETFSPVSFIYKVPPECIAVTDIEDARTQVSYAPLYTPEGWKEQIELYNARAQKESGRLDSFDALIRYPSITKSFEGKLVNNMNEVAFFSSAQGTSGEFYRPQLVGIFINHHHKVVQSDRGNAFINQNYELSARAFAESAHLPVIEIHSTETDFTPTEVHPLIKDWFGASKENFDQDFRHYVIGRKDGDEMRAYLTNEQKNALKEGNEQVKERLRHFVSEELYNMYLGQNSIPFDQIMSFVDQIQEPLSQAREQVLMEYPEYKNAMELLDRTKNMRKMYQLSGEQLAGYGLRN